MEVVSEDPRVQFENIYFISDVTYEEAARRFEMMGLNIIAKPGQTNYLNGFLTKAGNEFALSLFTKPAEVDGNHLVPIQRRDRRRLRAIAKSSKGMIYD